ncbi:MAG: putative sugar nucleotidyl transferase [Nitrososphaerota archaeon]|nr:putative sugar nucleotidyl transferase [Aigarchaeota archaeon]MDW8076225.1 putative sugar nucleotidyl transferase [Nitrososphaerota archaeon]
MRIAVFEDETYRNFFPLTLTRPVYELMVGTSTLREKIIRNVANSGEVVFFCRSYLDGVLREKLPGSYVNDFLTIDEDVVLINGLILADERLNNILQKLSGKYAAIIQKGRVVAARIKRDLLESPEIQTVTRSAENVTETLLKIVPEKLYTNEIHLLEYPWELIELNPKIITAELKKIKESELKDTVDASVTVYGSKENVFIGNNAFIESGTILDTRNGPIYIGENTYIQSPTRISGPVYIGRDCIIFGGQIREGCSIGDVCRIGGEVEGSIFHGYSNKRHYGFVGHSYVGEWVNLGAGTTNSDLKNTYGTIKIDVGGQMHDTGSMFVGMFVGDHVKTAIGTQIFSGKKIGVSSHLYGIVPEDVPSFTAYAKTLGVKPTEIYLESAIETARRMMRRRNIQPSEVYENMLKKVFELTEQERRRADVVRDRFSI